MTNKITNTDGNYILKIARQTIEQLIRNNHLLETPTNLPAFMNEKRGVFVTITENQELKGCIGYPEPIKPLINALIDSAVSAATGDPRFPPITTEQLDKIKIEVSILTPPQEIKINKPEEYLQKIKIGEDGLIIEKGFHRGLLLPQVAIEHHLNTQEFLEHTAIKAGLKPNTWQDKTTKIYKFQAQIFNE